VILRAVRSYLCSQKRATLADLANRFGIDESAVKGMLDLWIGKGQVRVARLASRRCGACCACPEAAEVYEWIDGGGAGEAESQPRRLPQPDDRC
jgi:hypothetical protein